MSILLLPSFETFVHFREIVIVTTFGDGYVGGEYIQKQEDGRRFKIHRRPSTMLVYVGMQVEFGHRLCGISIIP
jgi:hypothetical protein